MIFGRLARLPSDGLPYPVFALAALVPWIYFANALTQASNSLVDQRQMLTKVYFPRLLLPLAAVLAGLVDFAIASLMLLGVLLWYGIAPTVRLLAAPALRAAGGGRRVRAPGSGSPRSTCAIGTCATSSPSWCSSGCSSTPVAYSSTPGARALAALYGLNPMAGVVDGFRWAMLGAGSAVPGAALAASVVAIAALLCGAGLFVFRRMEQSFADVV